MLLISEFAADQQTAADTCFSAASTLDAADRKIISSFGCCYCFRQFQLRTEPSCNFTILHEFSSKKLQRLLDIQVHEKVKTGLGYNNGQYKSVPPLADYIAIHEPSFNVANLDTANRNLDPSTDELFVEDCTTSSESESTCSDHDETSAAPSEATLNRVEVPAVIPVIPAIPAPVPFKQIKISYPPDRRKLNIEKGETSGSTNPKPQSKPITKRKVFDICHTPGEKI
ncbi:hypothetical protein L1987_48609 [Smallanthus sonchifolius]|uniref:Uncharacterized protein n=1 Tax=Smallanthus sonchifolius TaxID=185202 RepID=A0ACB9FSX5_9ASTR|nr:hypothetical protein L1987_48609 [Smallanthus sonchifolius]